MPYFKAPADIPRDQIYLKVAMSVYVSMMFFWFCNFDFQLLGRNGAMVVWSVLWMGSLDISELFFVTVWALGPNHICVLVYLCHYSQLPQNCQ